MEINNILVPIDFSECAKNALRSAIIIAKKVDAKIHMVNAVHVHSPHPEITGGIIEEIVADYEEQVKQSFQELESELIELHDVPHEADRFVSYLTDAIYTETQEKKIDLIVMGTREKHETMEHLLGTRSTDVIDAIEVPILVIPEQHAGLAPKSIGFAFEYQGSITSETYGVLRRISEIFDAELLIFNVVADAQSISVKDQEILQKLRKVFGKINCPVRTIEANSASEGIERFTDSHELDMLAMMPKKHTFWERLFKKSITKSMAIDTKIPLLIFRD